MLHNINHSANIWKHHVLTGTMLALRICTNFCFCQSLLLTDFSKSRFGQTSHMKVKRVSYQKKNQKHISNAFSCHPKKAIWRLDAKLVPQQNDSDYVSFQVWQKKKPITTDSFIVVVLYSWGLIIIRRQDKNHFHSSKKCLPCIMSPCRFRISFI